MVLVAGVDPAARGERSCAFSFGRDRHVRRHADFVRIQNPSSGAGRATSAHFVFLIARTTGPAGGLPRLGLVVTKKIGGAVARNRIKRLCRECFRLTPGLLPGGVDLVVIARRGAPELGLAEVRSEWQRASGTLRYRAREALARAPEATHACARTAPQGDDDPRNRAC